MSNYTYIKTVRWLKEDQVEKDLQEILSRRFGNKIPYTRKDGCFTIGFEYPWRISLWIETRHKLEARDPVPQWAYWLMVVIK